ncbi:ribosomal L7Ae/L30e/S12e/Gadd45 family protein [Anaerovibrio slackiae]|uniref:50S ribosomal protein L7ae-like protein n=1 Tax=Anaerovibrio slackiae TaxID=2652309 RepID=A0A6I2UGQ1_9FIRM|nr:ribosomal L7Ae/L30e/S12e/Gadd45 family protein [Anaerovibrio slackiae]MBQ2409766.1 ribosomal L7Ae/L30e/S12e/Gadd45 family protein [Selenomonadaceae bacterium]MBQ5585504.1 ribosomal L7Ae/L30e/S12e/Gadd45 family protein [Selenomonadaceae bacterium]MBQ5733299.1 ribosomal L7Ae/L30e/S12e/Gadd45 family protein [Selenomonadaceae bacterium]MCI6098367.1 ribosomal L7Ae/L30e/S12e/Gadd45 family protein [Selenomonadaceae bacterium]MSU07946.1 50S ribosomal protein L7ae-like protein [Anaerovibrio slackiae
MTLERLKKAERVIGIKQVTKAINKNQALCVFIGTDADGRVIDPIRSLCNEKTIPVEAAYTMGELGRACSIEVGAAAVAILR